MKTKVILLFAISVAMVAGITITMITTIDKTRYRNDFVRIFPAHAADMYLSVALNQKYFTIAGYANHNVYLQSNGRLNALSLDMLDTCSISTDVQTGSEIIINDQYFFVQSGSTASLQRGSTQSWCVDTTFENLPGFTALEPISKSNAILRTVDNTGRKSVFSATYSPQVQKDLLKTQVDGILCTDGYLQFSESEKLLVYTYRYRNQFICIDTLLRKVRTGKTIDTTSIARIGVAETGGQVTMSKPPFVVNKGTSVSGKLLFVNSNLVAHNESPDIAKDRSTIDVYNITDGSYLYSFYIYDHLKQKMRSFKIQDSVLIAGFPSYVVRYDLATKYLRH